MLQPKKSTAELIVEQETLHTQQTNALAVKQEEYDRILERAQVVSEQKNALSWKEDCRRCERSCCSHQGLLSSLGLRMCACLRWFLMSLWNLKQLNRAWTLIELRTATIK